MNDKELFIKCMKQLGHDFHFNPELLTKDTISYIESDLFDSKARSCFYGKPYLNILYAGLGLVCVCDDEIRLFMEKYCEKAINEKFRVFDAPQIGYLERELNKYKYTIAHIAIYSIPEMNFYRESKHECIRILEGEAIEPLYELSDFPEALSYDNPKQDMLAVTYTIDGEIVGVAACSSDTDELWQIGVNVKEKYRNQGIAKKLVSCITEEILKRGKIPYYCCCYANIPSLNLSRKCGYRVAWVELTAKPLEEKWIKNLF